MTEQAAKRISVEEKFKTAREKSSKKDKENKKRFKRLAKKVADMSSKKNGQDAQRSKNLFSITHMSKTVQGTMSHNAFILGFIYL